MDTCVVPDRQTLRRVYDFGDRILNYTAHGNTLYSWEFWIEQWEKNPHLLLYSANSEVTVGAVWGWVTSDGNVTVGMIAVEEGHRKTGVGGRLMKDLVQRVRDSGHKIIALGALQESEEFYLKCGFSPNLFLQSKKHSLDELRALNTQYEEIWGLESDENGWCRLMLSTPVLDRALQENYDMGFEDCVPQTVFLMHL